VSGSGISWDICKSAPPSRQITTPAHHHSVFYRPDALPAAKPNSVKALKASLSNIDVNNGYIRLFKLHYYTFHYVVLVRNCDTEKVVLLLVL